MSTAYLRRSFGVFFSITLVGSIFSNSVIRGEELPEYIKLISPAKTKSENSKSKSQKAGQIASKNILSLDKAMMPIYASALKKSQSNILSQTPIIIARFTGVGGEMPLYRPGKPSLVAKTPSIDQYAKSCGHSAMAIYQLTVPYMTDPSRGEWRRPMQIYRDKIQTALGTLNTLDVTEEQRSVLRAILENNLNFMNHSLKSGTFTLKELDAFAKNFKSLADKAIWIAADTQASHWMTVLDQWKKMLGDDWDKLHAATNTMYVTTRQNNILFSVLVQYVGKDAIHRRHILFETTEFVTSEEQMLSLLTRVIADRSLGMVYFGNYYLMDYKLLGGGARRAVIEQCKKRGMTPILPTMSPFNSTEWPWRTDPKSSTGHQLLSKRAQQSEPLKSDNEKVAQRASYEKRKKYSRWGKQFQHESLAHHLDDMQKPEHTSLFRTAWYPLQNFYCLL